MVTVSLSQLSADINAHIQSQEELETKLRQADSLARIGESADFDQYSNPVIRHYLLTLTELLEQATQLSEHLSVEMCRLASTLGELPDVK
jgi:hypothetical protein